MFYKNSESKSLDHSITFLLKILGFYKENYISNLNRAYANTEAEDFQWNLITQSDLKGNLGIWQGYQHSELLYRNHDGVQAVP